MFLANNDPITVVFHLKRVDGSRPSMTKFALLSQLPHVDSYRSFKVTKVTQGHVSVLLVISLVHYRHLQQQNCLLATTKDTNITTMAIIVDSDGVKDIDVKTLTQGS